MTRALGPSIALALCLPACGGAVTSGMAAGEVGRKLSSHTDAVPQGAEICAVREALAYQPTQGREKRAWGEECSKALARDQLWGRAMIVLASHGDTLEALAAGEDDNPGHLQAALTGVKGKDWLDVEDEDTAARDAVAKLVEQMGKHTSDTELEDAVKAAAPHVKTICAGLNAYLDEQAQSLSELSKEVEKKREERTEKRCGTLDNRHLCVSDTTTDRVIYANTAGQLRALENSHAEARDDVAGFCAAHEKLADAASKGTLDDEATYTAIVQAVKSARKGPPPIEEAPPSDAPADKAPQPKAASEEAKK